MKNQGIEDFDWSAFDDGWNGVSLKSNTKLKARSGDIIFCHEAYADEIYKKYNRDEAVLQDVKPDSLAKITDIQATNNPNEVLVTLNGGLATISIDLNKENRFFDLIKLGDGDELDKEKFVKMVGEPSLKQGILNLDLMVKVGKRGDNASIWDGYLGQMYNELQEQITKNSKAYIAHVESSNNGGYIVTIGGCVTAFMPGSMAAANRITDFDALLGKDMEVMVEKFDKRFGFIVSRKKYLRTVLPYRVKNLQVDIEKDPDACYVGTVTGTTHFGIFVELDEVLTGMIHKTLISDELNARFKAKEIQPGEQIDVYVHNIDNNRIILSDVPKDAREEIIVRRTKEDEAEKAARKAAEGKTSDKNDKEKEEAERKEKLRLEQERIAAEKAAKEQQQLAESIDQLRAKYDKE